MAPIPQNPDALAPLNRVDHPTGCGHHACVRELFPEPQNTLRQGAGWPRFAGCVLALMLLATSAIANPRLDLTNSTCFFTNVAMAMFKQMNLHDFNGNLVTVTNIPIYEDPTLFGGTNVNYYTPAVHRILQLAANIFDATTNRFINGGPTNYPTVFRPIFSSQNGIASIVGYVEVTNSSDAFLPFLDPTNFVQQPQLNTNINIYGVPWVIGAKKGFPNFNKMSMVNQLQVIRKLQFTNVQGRASLPWQTNQVFEFGVSNGFGVEVWNSYVSSYGRPLQLFITNELFLQVTNETGATFLSVNDLGFGSNLFFDGWPGCNFSQVNAGLADPSFQIPLQASTTYTNAIYNQDGTITPLTPPEWAATYAPHFWMGLNYRMHYVLIDTSANRVIDFVNLVGPAPQLQVVNVISNLTMGMSGTRDSTANAFADIWETNLVNSGVVLGVLNLIDANLGQPGGLPGMTTSPNGGTIEQFQRNLWGNGNTPSFQTADSAVGIINELFCWSANDPLVHYTIQDLTAQPGNVPGSSQIQFNKTPPQVDPDGTTLKEAPPAGYLSNLGRLYGSYQPWGGYPMNNGGGGGGTAFANQDLQVKDPGIQQSDDWNFPTGESLTFEWLGRVHRGTPWQTVFLKPSNLTLEQWLTWNNDNILITNGNLILADAAFTLPTNDWRIASLWAQWLNTNDLSTLLSINNIDTNAWAARLDGLTALINPAPGELDPITITSNSPQAEIIAQAIQVARANTNPANGVVFPNQLFQQVGDVLATPQLTVASPFINTNGLSSGTANGITDEALEIIPTQLLPLLRLDSIGQITPAKGQLQLSFTGYDGHAYAIQASSNLTDWVVISTNCPSDGTFEITNITTSGQQFYRSVLLH